MAHTTVRRRWLAGEGAIVCDIPRQLKEIPEIWTSIFLGKKADLMLKPTIEAIGAELRANPAIWKLIFSEGPPTSLEFEMYLRTDLFEMLANKLGYMKYSSKYLLMYGVTVTTPVFRAENHSRHYTLSISVGDKTTSLPITQEMIDGYRGDGLVMIPIPSQIIDERMSKIYV